MAPIVSHRIRFSKPSFSGRALPTTFASCFRRIGSGHFVVPHRIPGSGRAADTASRQEALKTLRAIMTKYVGVQRSGKGLKTALAELKALTAIISANDRVLSNMLLAARLIAAAALSRKESRGGHYRIDYPSPNPVLAHRTFMTLADLEAMDVTSKPPERSAAGGVRLIKRQQISQMTLSS